MIRALAALLAAAPAAAQPVMVGDAPANCYRGSRASAAVIDVVGLKDTSGELRVEIYPATRDDFLKDFDDLRARGRHYHRVILPVTGGDERVCILAPGTGPWAVAVIHSRGGRRGFGWRTDGIGFANNPGFGFGPPSFEKATTMFGQGPIGLRIVMKYFRGFGMKPLPGVR